MKTDRPLVFNEHVVPICLPEETGGPEIGQMCMVGGWGDTMGTGNQFVLNEVSVPIISYETCQSWYDDEFIRIFEQEHLCAGFEMGKQDACQGKKPKMNFNLIIFKVTLVDLLYATTKWKVLISQFQSYKV